jgi:hypothetical protein
MGLARSDKDRLAWRKCDVVEEQSAQHTHIARILHVESPGELYRISKHRVVIAACRQNGLDAGGDILCGGRHESTEHSTESRGVCERESSRRADQRTESGDASKESRELSQRPE